MQKPKALAKFALITAFAAALAGCGPAVNTPSETTSTQNTVTVDTGLHVVNDYDRYIDRYVDFATNQLCLGKTGKASSLACRNFEDLSPGQRAYVDDMGVLLHRQDPSAVRPGTNQVYRDNISLNTTSRVFNEYGSYYERYVDFKTEMLCVSKTGNSSALTCTDFSAMTPAQKSYVDYARQEMDKAAQPAPKS